MTSKTIDSFDNALFSNDDIAFGDIDSAIVTFFSNGIGLNGPYNVNLDDVKFDDYDPEAISHVGLTAWHNRYKQHKACKRR